MSIFVFKSYSNQVFNKKFSSDSDCNKYLYDYKWKNGFECTKCDGKEFWNGTKEYSVICRKCRKIHTATQTTVFHGLRFSLKTAFKIIYDTDLNEKKISDLEVSRRYGVNRNTASLFMKKIRKAWKDSQ